MTLALWVIAICEVIRIVQNTMQLLHVKKSERMTANVHEEFIKSLKKTDKEFVRDMLEEFERQEAE